MIAALWKVPRRLTEYHFEQAHTLDDVPKQHAAFIETLNTPPPWAQRTRATGHRTPGEVRGWLRGRVVAPPGLRALFGRPEFLRTGKRSGFVSVQHGSLSAQHGLARQRASSWIDAGPLSSERVS